MIAGEDWHARWARVTILLNTGEVAAATAAAVAASALTDWDAAFGDYQQMNRVCIYDTPELPVGWFWMEPERNRTLLARKAVEEFALSYSMFSFSWAVLGMTAPAFRRFDTANWRALYALEEQERLDRRDQ